jgi:hypothetical protein
MPHPYCLQGSLTIFDKILQLISIYKIVETREADLEGVLID